MYKSLNNLAKMFDISPSYIKKHYFNSLKEGIHFTYVGTMKRFNVKEMKKLLMSETKKENSVNSSYMDRFLLES